MKKSLLFSAAMALSLGLAVNAQAETAYGLMSGYPSWGVCSYDWAELGNVNAVKLFDVPFGVVQAAASVGNTYYVYATIPDYTTYIDNLVFASVNMETQETVIIKEFGDVNGENGFILRDLASDGATLYAIKDDNLWDDATESMSYGCSLLTVNVEDGSFESKGRIEATCWGLACKDGDLYVVKTSGLKGWSYLFDLCKVNEDCSLTPITSNQDVATSEMAPSHAVATAQGICFFSGATPYLFDLAAGTITKVDDDVTQYQSYTGTTFTPSTQSAGPAVGGDDDEAQATRLLVAVSSFGDFMGASASDKLTAQRQYFYNENLQVVAVVETATGQTSAELEPQYYNPYVYDAQGNLVKKDHYQYGLYDYGDMAMHQAAGVVEYEYDALGNCIKETESENVTTYEYDADGNCIKEVRSAAGKEGKTILYSDFSAGKNKPALASASHTNNTFTGEFYDESREYDAQGRLVKTQRICNRDYVEDHGFWQITTSLGDFMQEEHWTYEGPQLMLYEKFTSIDEETGELQPYLKTVYTVKDENTVGLQSYTAFGNEWYKSGVYQEETYCEFAGMADVTGLQLVSVEKAETGVNDAKVEFTVPEIAFFNPNVAFTIYRNGGIATTVHLMDVIMGEADDVTINEETGNLVYTDSNLRSGNYDYFVQVMTANGANDGGIEPLGDDVDSGFGVEPLSYTGYCASNIVAADLTLDLPAATNVNIRQSEKDSHNYNYVTIGFTAPDAAPELGFKTYELIVGNAQIGEDRSSNPAVTELHCTLADDTAWVSILTRYQYGNVLSEKVFIDVNNIPANSIEELRELGLEDMLVFDASGRQVNASLESLHGNYIVIIGKTAHKVVLK